MTKHTEVDQREEVLARREGALRKCAKPVSVLGRPQGSGTKLTSGASSRTKPARLSDGEGEARRKAGFVECIESLLLPLLKRGQGVATD